MDRRWPAEPAPTASETAALFETVAEGPADIDRVAAAYALGRSQSQAAVEALLQQFAGARAPQHVQNLVMRDYCDRHDFLFRLSATEYAMADCHMMLEQVLVVLDQVEN